MCKENLRNLAASLAAFLLVAVLGGSALVGIVNADVGDNLDQNAAYVFGPPLTPAALTVDPAPTASSDGNRVFEPGETVDVAPAWRNNGTAPLSLTGTASDFTGPPGATYTLEQVGADYGTLDPDQTASCLDTGICYAMGADDPAVRPAAHWDATFDEALNDPDGTAKTWTLHIGDSFTDVPPTSLFYPWIETVLHSGVTAGCDADAFCPDDAITRGQLAVFMLRALLGTDYTPPPCVAGEEIFDDVPASSPFCSWIQDLVNRGIVSGCGADNFCPGSLVNRAQMAIFLLKTLEGAGYEPPECQGLFTDVPCPSLFADWIEDLVVRGVTAGCSATEYCPAAEITRAQFAVFVIRTFDLTLYGP